MPLTTDFHLGVYLSHNTRYKLKVRKPARRLKSAGLRVWFDDWGIQPGRYIYLAIERGLEALRTLASISSSAAGVIRNWS